MTLRGPEPVFEVVRIFWEALPDAKIAAHYQSAVGDTVVAEGTLGGTHTGPFRSPQGDSPASGNSVNLRYASVKQIRDGRVATEHLTPPALRTGLQAEAGLAGSSEGPFSAEVEGMDFRYVNSIPSSHQLPVPCTSTMFHSASGSQARVWSADGTRVSPSAPLATGRGGETNCRLCGCLLCY